MAYSHSSLTSEGIQSTEGRRDAGHQSTKPAPRGQWRRRLKIIAFSISLAVWLICFIDGYSYYTTPYAQRPHHADYRELRPAGTRGLLFGIVGASMLTLMLGYTLRKRVSGLSRWGALPYWLDVHIYFGVMGPLFILLHTSFKVQGLVAVAFWSMVCVAVSGVVGRYLYAQIPRNLRGDQLTLEETRQQNEVLRKNLRDEFGLSDQELARLDAPARSGRSQNAWIALLRLVAQDVGRLTARRNSGAVRGLGQSQQRMSQLNNTIQQIAILDRRIEVWQQVQQLFHYWHVFHKPFAIVMYIVMGIHIVVAVWTGYGWVS